MVTNRVTSSEFPNTYCKVITQHKAFSWYLKFGDLMPNDPLLWLGEAKKIYRGDLIELSALARSLALATWHYTEVPLDTTEGALYYMTIDGHQNIEKAIDSSEFLSVEDDHIFFKRIGWR